MKKIIDGLGYREWQKRNSDRFRQLSATDRKEAKIRGYRNLGWESVQKSWEILQTLGKVTSLFDRKIQTGDLVGAIDLALHEADLAKEEAQEAKVFFRQSKKRTKDLLERTRKKYGVS